MTFLRLANRCSARMFREVWNMNKHKFTDLLLPKFKCRAVAVFTFLLGFGVEIVGAWFDFDPIGVGVVVAAFWLSAFWLLHCADKLVQNERKSVRHSDMKLQSSDDALRPGKSSSPWSSFRFNLKSLLVLTLFLCVLFACVGIRFKEIERQRSIAAGFQAKGTHVTFVRGNVVTIQPFGDVSDDDLALLKYFPHLKMLFLQDSHLGDSALRHTQGLKSLEWLVPDRSGDLGLRRAPNRGDATTSQFVSSGNSCNR